MTPEFPSIGRTLLLTGLLLAGLGALLMIEPKLSWFGRLPGDIAIRRGGFSFYFPLTSCLVASAVISLVLWAIGRFRP